MKYFKYLIVSILCGAGIVLGAFLMALTLPELFQRTYDEEDRIKYTETRIGVSCAELHQEATEFLNDSGEEILERAQEGSARAEVLSNSQRRYLARMKRPLLDCVLLSRSTTNHEGPGPTIDQIHYFVEMLLHVQANEDRPKSISIGESYMLRSAYKNVTSQGSEGASRRDAVTGAPA